MTNDTFSTPNDGVSTPNDGVSTPNDGVSAPNDGLMLHFICSNFTHVCSILLQHLRRVGLDAWSTHLAQHLPQQTKNVAQATHKHPYHTLTLEIRIRGGSPNHIVNCRAGSHFLLVFAQLKSISAADLRRMGAHMRLDQNTIDRVLDALKR